MLCTIAFRYTKKNDCFQILDINSILPSLALLPGADSRETVDQCLLPGTCCLLNTPTKSPFLDQGFSFQMGYQSRARELNCNAGERAGREEKECSRKFRKIVCKTSNNAAAGNLPISSVLLVLDRGM